MGTVLHIDKGFELAARRIYANATKAYEKKYPWEWRARKFLAINLEGILENFKKGNFSHLQMANHLRKMENMTPKYLFRYLFNGEDPEGVIRSDD